MSNFDDTTVTEQDRASRAFQQALRDIHFGQGPWSPSLTRAVAQIFFWPNLHANVVAMAPTGDDGIDAAALGLAHRAEMAATPELFEQTGMGPFESEKWAKVGIRLLSESRSTEVSQADSLTTINLIQEMLSSPGLPKSLVTFYLEPKHAYERYDQVVDEIYCR